MRLVLLGSKMFEESSRFVVGDNRIRALNGYFSVSVRELLRARKYADMMWRKVASAVDLSDDFRAHIRFDLVPSFKGVAEKRGDEYYLGELYIKDIYEVNTHSPECMSCDALFRESFPHIAQHTPSATKALASTIKREYKTIDVTIVKGCAVTRDSWFGALQREFLRSGVTLKEASPEKALDNGATTIWRWGNVDFEGNCNEFTDDFQRKLFTKQQEVDVFNSIPEAEKDVANKGLLAGKKDILLDNEYDLHRSLVASKDDYVLKPLIGTSGKGIIFGEDLSTSDFKKVIINAYNRGGHGLFKKVLLPKITVTDELEDFTIDFLPSFFAKGRSLHYLYSVVRAEPWSSYRRRKTINVFQGGGYGGSVAVRL